VSGLQTDGRVEQGRLLTVENLSTTFATERGPVRAVDQVSLSLDRGQALGIVGESGSGKTVLSRSIMGLLPSTARREGSIRFGDHELLGSGAVDMSKLWGREMSMVFQNPMVSLNPVMRIGEQIAEPLRIHLGMSRRDARATAVRLLRDVRIPEPERRVDQYPHELFADEPTTALDVTVQAQILDLIAEQREERNMSVVLVTHDLGVVAGHTDVIAVMYGGRLVEVAPTAVLFADMRMPYTEALLQSIPRLDQPSHTRLAAIPGRPPDLLDPPRGCAFAPRCAFARDRCREEAPTLTPADNPEHRFACWYPVGSAEYLETRERIASGLTIGGRS
jgi:peptide/nickel transport system ATP-binding protein